MTRQDQPSNRIAKLNVMGYANAESLDTTTAVQAQSQLLRRMNDQAYGVHIFLCLFDDLEHKHGSIPAFSKILARHCVHFCIVTI